MKLLNEENILVRNSEQKDLLIQLLFMLTHMHTLNSLSGLFSWLTCKRVQLPRYMSKTTGVLECAIS